MRILYRDPSNHAENAAYNDLLSRIDKWWEAFGKVQKKISAVFESGAAPPDQEWLLDWMTRNVQAIHPQLMWEFGPAKRKPIRHADDMPHGTLRKSSA